MASLPKQIIAERANVEEAIHNLHDAMDRPVKTVIELAAMGTFLHNFYNGIENILKQSLKLKNVNLDRNGNWHKELLNFSVAHGVISEEISDELYEYLTFRHFFVHAYGFMLEEAPLEALTVNIGHVWSRFLSEIENYFKAYDPAHK